MNAARGLCSRAVVSLRGVAGGWRSRCAWGCSWPAAGVPVALASGMPCSLESFAGREECQFGSRGAGPGQFAIPNSVAVNQATGDVYVLDEQDSRVDEFSGVGVFVRSFGEGLARPEPVGGLP